MTETLRYPSRRNSVTLIQSPDSMVVKQFPDIGSYYTELSVYQQYGQFDYFPAVLSCGTATITKQYIGGSTLLDMLEQCEPAADYDSMYSLLVEAVDIILHFHSHTQCIFTDVNFSNFIVGDRLYFVDVEQVAEGDCAHDIALLGAFLTTYTPSHTSYKLQLYTQLLQYVSAIDAQLGDRVASLYIDKLGMLALRRNKK